MQAQPVAGRCRARLDSGELETSPHSAVPETTWDLELCACVCVWTRDWRWIRSQRQCRRDAVPSAVTPGTRLLCLSHAAQAVSQTSPKVVRRWLRFRAWGPGPGWPLIFLYLLISVFLGQKRQNCFSSALLAYKTRVFWQEGELGKLGWVLCLEKVELKKKKEKKMSFKSQCVSVQSSNFISLPSRTCLIFS